MPQPPIATTPHPHEHNSLARNTKSFEQKPIMATQLTPTTIATLSRKEPLHHYSHHSSLSLSPPTTSLSWPAFATSFPLLDKSSLRPHGNDAVRRRRSRRDGILVVAASSNAGTAPFWDAWKPEKASSSPSLSDVVWPSAGAFAAMALLGKMDQILAPKGVSMTIAPLGAVCAVLLATPSSPGARKYNIFMAQIGCAAIGVLAFSILGPGWLARSASLAASIAFMIITRSTHPPAASLPILFIDGAKLHHLNFWYTLFPGAAGCILICLIQEVVVYLKNNLKF